jgi:hypothetical protein
MLGSGISQLCWCSESINKINAQEEQAILTMVHDFMLNHENDIIRREMAQPVKLDEWEFDTLNLLIFINGCLMQVVYQLFTKKIVQFYANTFKEDITSCLQTLDSCEESYQSLLKNKAFQKNFGRMINKFIENTFSNER